MPEQVTEEEAPYLEHKHPERTEWQFKKDGGGLLSTLLGIESGLSDTQLGGDLSLPGLSFMPEIKKNNKGKAGDQMELDSPSGDAPPSSLVRKRCILLRMLCMVR